MTTRQLERAQAHSTVVFVAVIVFVIMIVPALLHASLGTAAPKGNPVRGKSPGKRHKPSSAQKGWKGSRAKRVRATDPRLTAALWGAGVALPAGILAQGIEAARPLTEPEREALADSVRDEIEPLAEPPAQVTPPTPRLIWPLVGPLNSPFGPRHGGFHAGIDIGAPRYQVVVAAADGLVLYASASHGPMGKVVVLRHAEGFLTAYAHLSRIVVKEGQTIRQGKALGAVGSTGHSTGPHLHFAVRLAGRAVNPEDLLPPRPDTLTASLPQTATAK